MGFRRNATQYPGSRSRTRISKVLRSVSNVSSSWNGRPRQAGRENDTEGVDKLLEGFREAR